LAVKSQASRGLAGLNVSVTNTPHFFSSDNAGWCDTR
jgi:hypothetical protein